MQLKPDTRSKILKSLGRIIFRRLPRCFRFLPGNPSPSASVSPSPSPSAIQIEPWLVIVLCVFALAEGASGETGNRLVFETRPDQWSRFGTPGDVSLDHVTLSFSDRSEIGDIFSRHTEPPVRGMRDRDRCPVEGYLDVMPDLRAVPGWVLSDMDKCRPAKSSLRQLIPNIRIEGTLFHISYGLEVDRVKKGLLIDYGAFSFGIGDSPTGGIILGGASFGLPRWMPGSRLIPDRIREELQIDVGIRLPIDSMNVREWQPNFGIGVKLLHW